MRVEGLKVTYDGEREVLYVPYLEIPVRKVTCVLGPNGSGKTSLLKAIAGLVEARGTVYLEGAAFSPSRVGTFRRLLAYAGRPPEVSEVTNMRVLEALLIARSKGAGLFEKEEEVREVLEVAKRLGVSHLLSRRLGELSDGELRRVVVAMAMVRRPLYYLLDEPDAHVDVGFKTELAKIVRDLAEGSTVLVSTHDPLFAQLTCDYVVVLRAGRVLFQGWIGDLVSRPGILEEAFGARFTHVTLAGGRVLLVPMLGSYDGGTRLAETRKGGNEGRDEH